MTRPVLCRNCQKNAESRQATTRSQIAKQIGASHGSKGISAQNAGHKRNAVLRQQCDNSSRGKAADKTVPNAVSTPRNSRSSKKWKGSEKQNLPTVDSMKIYLGNSSEDTEPEENDFEIIDEAEFRKNEAHFASKIGLSVAEELGEDYALAASQENVKYKSKKEQPVNSGPTLQKGNNNGSMNSKEHTLGEADKRNFRTERSPFPQKIWFPTEQPINGYSLVFHGENADFLYGKRSFGNVDDGYDIDQIHKSTSLSKEGNGSRDVVHDEFVIEKIVGVGFSGKTHAAPKIVTSTRKESADMSRKIYDDVDNNRFSDLHRSIPSEDGGRDSARGSVDKSISQSQKGNNDEDMDPAEPELGRIDEAESTHKKMHSAPKIKSSIWQDRTGGSSAIGLRVTVNGLNQKLLSTENSVEIDLGVASRTRSKKRLLTESDEVGYIHLDSSSSDSSDGKSDSSDGESDSSDDEASRKIDNTSSNVYGNNQEQLMADDVCSLPERGQAYEMQETHKEAQPEPEPESHSNLPLKFRFEDEIPKPEEKTEYEKEMDGYFSELNFCWELSEMGSFDRPKIDEENEEAPPEETQHSRCCRGKHELVLEDDQGLICFYCQKLVVESRYVLPPWADKVLRKSEGRKRSWETEKLPEFDDIHLQSSMGNSFNSSFGRGGTVWTIKPGIRESMYQHQQEGFEFLWKNLAGSINLAEISSCDPNGVGGCIISHAPGTGKTRLTINFIQTYLKLFPNCRPVIIAPASMLLTWEEEFKKWNVEFPFHNLNNLEFSGKENKNALSIFAGASRRDKYATRMVKIFSWNEGTSVLGISYSLYEKLTAEKYSKLETGKKRKREEAKAISAEKMKNLRKILLEKPGLVFLDEGHTPRNRRSNIWNALCKLHTGKRVILSGTPFQNNFAELFNIMRLVRPSIADVFFQEKTLAEMITSRRKNKRKNSDSGPISSVIDHAVDKLKAAISPFVHVHKGTILQQSLPGLKDCVIMLNPPSLQKSLIERLEGSPSTFKFEHNVALISTHPYLFKYCDSTDMQSDGVDMDAVESSKLNPNEGVKANFVLELVRLSMAMKEKVLVFSQYIQPLELIRDQLIEIFKWVDGKNILRMEGKIDQKQRQILINTFNDPESVAKVMLASTRCCSEGISLVGASRVVLLDVVWNPSVENQAISRAYRIGQKRFVYTYHLMTSGTTEADKYCRQAEKERLSELVFSSYERKLHVSGTEDRILEGMIGNPKFKDMFERIIHQPKDLDLIETFGLTS